MELLDNSVQPITMNILEIAIEEVTDSPEEDPNVTVTNSGNYIVE